MYGILLRSRAAISSLMLAAVIFLCLQSTESMKCREYGGADRSKQDFNDVVRACMANVHNDGSTMNKKPVAFNTRNEENQFQSQSQRRQQNQGNQQINRGNVQQQGNQKGSYGDSKDDSDESPYPPHYNGYRPSSGSGFGLGNYYSSSGNSRNPSSFANPFEQKGGRRQQNNTNRETSKHGISSPLENIEPCIIHCVFQQMHMLGGNSKPEKNSVMNVMTQKIRNPELREFIQDSISDCFEAVESEPQYQIGRCDFSKKLALCLEEKGQQNCEDWDEDVDEDSNNKKRGSNNNFNKSNNNNHFNSNPRPSNNPYRG